MAIAVLTHSDDSFLMEDKPINENLENTPRGGDISSQLKLSMMQTGLWILP